MNLNLGVVLSCDETSCQVKLVESEEVLTAQYSRLVRDRIWIKAQQLVAIDQRPTKPEIVWRWVPATVREVNDQTIGFEDNLGQLEFASRVAALPLKISRGDEGWFCQTDQDLEIHDLIVAGKPAHPQRVLGYITPIITRVYATN